MKTDALDHGSRQFVTDEKGNRIAVLLDLATYESLREAAEDLADIQAYDQARPGIMREINRGDFTTLEAYARRRKLKPSNT